ncbi:MAG: glycoside hydrolase family 18 protein [Ferruginibacter sp.]
MKITKICFFALLLSLSIVSCSKEDISGADQPELIAPPPGFGYYVIGYFPNYRSLSDVQDIKFRMCNVVNYAFFNVNSSGLLTVNNSALAAAVIQKAHANGAKVMLSINDGAAGNFKNMAATVSGRKAFVKDVMGKLRGFGFDGVDIDWEFPSLADDSYIGFAALMKELSDSLHKGARYYLSAAIISGKYAGSREAITNEVFSYADWFNIMAYDDFTTMAAQQYRHHSDYTLASTCLNYWLGRGMPRSKAVLGLPAYGRPSGMTQSGTVLSFRTILSQGGSHLSDSAFVTAGGYTNYKIYYNGQPSIKKKAMLAKNIANGVMLWEMWQDAADDKSLLKAVCDTVGRSY